MASIQVPTRRLILAGGFAAAIAIVPAVAVFAGPIAGPAATYAQTECPPGEDWDIYISYCIPHTAPGASAGPSTIDGIPAIDGIPCDGRHSGTCIGLSEQQPAPVQMPDTTVHQSP